MMSKEPVRTKMLDASEDDPSLFPTELDGHTRADRVIEDRDRPKNWKRSPDVPSEELEALRITERKPRRGVTVKTDRGDKLVLVSFNPGDGREDTVVCVVQWLPQGRRFRINKRLFLENRFEQPVEYTGSIHEAWSALGEWGVSVDEFQEAFVELPPEIDWNFERCPRGGMECKLTYWGDPRTQKSPGIACRTCGAKFRAETNGNLVLVEAGDAGEKPWDSPSTSDATADTTSSSSDDAGQAKKKPTARDAQASPGESSIPAVGQSQGPASSSRTSRSGSTDRSTPSGSSKKS